MSWFRSLKRKINIGKRASAKFRILEISDDDFKMQVIRRSHKTPVMVDFWAAWCGPCRQLGPVLERLAEEPDSQFILAKLNTEHNERSAARYQIRTIPAVKMFRNGRVVAEFTGVMPEPLIRRFVAESLDALAPPLGFKGSDNPAKRLQQATHHLKKGKGFEAFVLLNDFPDSQQATKAEKLLPLARFLCDIEDGDGLTGLEDLDECYLDAADALQRRQPAQALDCLFDALAAGESFDHSYTTAVIQSLLTLLGEKHPLTQEYQPKLETS